VYAWNRWSTRPHRVSGPTYRTLDLGKRALAVHLDVPRGYQDRPPTPLPTSDRSTIAYRSASAAPILSRRNGFGWPGR